MESDFVIAFVIVTTILISTNVHFIILWRQAVARAAKAEEERARLSQASDDARAERMEQSIESIALEVERLAEGQRFAAKLLSEARDAERLAIPRKGISTPH